MTASHFSGLRSLPENAAGMPPVADSPHRTRDALEPSLIELVGLSDWQRVVPEALGILFFIVLIRTLLPDLFAGSLMPHPFWIPVLILSGQYGIMGGLFATLAATAALFLSGLPPQSATQDFYVYAGAVAAQPCAWLAATLVLGGLRTLHIHQQTDLQQRLHQTERRAEDLADGLERAVQEIGRLEHRVAGDSSTLASFLYSFAKLELTDCRSLVASFADVVRHGVGATSFTIYLRDHRGLTPYLCIADGARMGTNATSPFEPSLLNAAPRKGEGPAVAIPCLEDVPCWAPIRQTGSGTSVGIIVCSRLEPSRDPAIAAQRLTQICGVLAALLPMCLEARSGVLEYANG
jgi:hypothetical protein